MHGTLRYVSRKIPLEREGKELACQNNQVVIYYLLQRQDAVMQSKCSTLQQDDAILFLLGINRWCIGTLGPCQELLFENVREELSHAFFIATVLEIHWCHKRLGLGVSIRTFQKHPEVVNRADIVLADVNDEAWICFLLDGDLSTLFFGSDFNAWLGYLNLLFVQV